MVDFHKTPKENFPMKKLVRIASLLSLALLFLAPAGTAHAISIKALYAGRTKLNGKKAVVSGRVIKINKNIMGKNWIHLKDGTGPKGMDEVVLTTSQSAKPGERVSATCTVSADKDFGAGYFYKVILENCVLKPL